MKHVKFKKHNSPYNAGEHAGFADHEFADRLVKLGVADYCDKNGKLLGPSAAEKEAAAKAAAEKEAAEKEAAAGNGGRR
ncbi:MAG TPA: hypothetical protein VGM17_02295 [Rhizomicrobium sp.]